MLHLLFIGIGSSGVFSKNLCHDRCVDSMNGVAPLDQDSGSKPISVEEGGHREGKHE